MSLIPYVFYFDAASVQCARPSQIEPDGLKLFNLEDAARKSGIPEERLRQRWDAEWGYIFGRMKEGTINPRPEPDEPDVEMPIELPPTPLVLKVQTAEYRCYVTAERLRDSAGNVAVGLCLWAEKLILVSGPDAGKRREEIWFHEARHAYEFELPAPQDGGEAATDWLTKVHLWSQVQLDEQGGRPLLESMKPVAGVAPLSALYEEPIAEPKTKMSDESLFRIKWPMLPPKLVPLKMKELVAMKIHPFGKSYYIKGSRREWGMDYEVVLKIGELRRRRDKAGGFDGNDETTYTWEEGNRFPVSCTYTGYKIIEGRRVKIIATVYWSDAYGDELHKISEVVLAKPKRCMAVLAEAYFLAQGWGEECGDIVVSEETIAPPISQRAAAKTLPVAKPSKPLSPIPPNDRPQSELVMHTRLVELGYQSERSRNILITKVIRLTGSAQPGEERDFYARVIIEAKKEKGLG